jgi:hypothetical protein
MATPRKFYMGVKIYFGNIEKDNLSIRIESKEQSLLLTASYIPYNSLSELVYSLITVLTCKNIDVNVRWSTEPVEYEFHFSGDSNNVCFLIREYADSRRVLGIENQVFYANGSRFEIVLPFWRALRQFQSYPSNINRWRHPFPFGEMDRLSEMIKNLKD